MPTASPPVPTRSCARPAPRHRLRRIEGQGRALQRMVEHDHRCIDVRTQVQAAQAALDSVALSLLERRVRTHVLLNHGPQASESKTAELMQAVARLLRRPRPGGPHD